LDHNFIEDKGVHCIADMLKKNRILTDLWLSYNDISDDGVQSLANVLQSDNETLIQLYLNENKLISDCSISFLVQMFEFNRTLTTFWLQNCSLSQDGKVKLEQIVESRKNFDLYV
ncbi:unnamed protein product, partial [Rotaria sp. Silwood2]